MANITYDHVLQTPTGIYRINSAIEDSQKAIEDKYGKLKKAQPKIWKDALKAGSIQVVPTDHDKLLVEEEIAKVRRTARTDIFSTVTPEALKAKFDSNPDVFLKMIMELHMGSYVCFDDLFLEEATAPEAE